MLKKFGRIQVGDQVLSRLQDAVGKVLDVVTAIQMLDGVMVSTTVKTTGTNVTHKLGRAYIGWWVVSPQGAGNVYEDTAASADKTTTLVLRANADVTVRLWVF